MRLHTTGAFITLPLFHIHQEEKNAEKPQQKSPI